MTPSARALSDLRKDGYTPWVVERNITPIIKRDLFNCIDILAIKDGVTLAVQVTAGSAHANRVAKVKESEYLALMLGAGWVVEVWSYRKAASGRYVRRIERIGEPAFDHATTGKDGLKDQGQLTHGKAASSCTC